MYWKLKSKSLLRGQSIATAHITLGSLQLWIWIQLAHWSLRWHLSDAGAVSASRHSWPESDWISRTLFLDSQSCASSRYFVLSWNSYGTSGFSLPPTSQLAGTNVTDWNTCTYKAASPIVIYRNAHSQITSPSLLCKPDFNIKISILYPHLRTVCLDLNTDLTGTSLTPISANFSSMNTWCSDMAILSSYDRPFQFI
jgi:hypothetical protein